MITRKYSAPVLASFTAMLLATASCPAAPADQVPAGAVATVNGQAISEAEFHAYYADLARKRFWHGGIAPEKVDALRQEVIERLVLYRLVLGEAERRGIAGNPARVEQQIDAYRARMQNQEARNTFEQNVPQLRQELLESSKVEALEAEIRAVTEPSDATLRKFHAKRIDAFTEPASERVSLILVGLPPTSTKEEWDAAEAKARQTERELRAGADFAALARERSTDQTAASGGDMGYVHRGMLADPAQGVVDKLQPGQVSEPVRLLQGYAIFRVAERKPPVPHAFEEVREKVAELYRRDTAEEQWRAFAEKLKSRSVVKIGAVPQAATPGASK